MSILDVKVAPKKDLVEQTADERRLAHNRGAREELNKLVTSSLSEQGLVITVPLEAMDVEMVNALLPSKSGTRQFIRTQLSFKDGGLIGELCLNMKKDLFDILQNDKEQKQRAESNMHQKSVHALMTRLIDCTDADEISRIQAQIKALRG